VSAVLRRRPSAVVDLQPVLRYDGVTIDLANMRLTVAGRKVMLSGAEWMLLSLLARQPGCVVTHAALQAELWGSGHHVTVAHLRTWISRLRRRLHTDAPSSLITTFAGIGYRLEPPPAHRRA
jgi:two-component system KDP operon response regulator KdpE